MDQLLKKIENAFVDLNQRLEDTDTEERLRQVEVDFLGKKGIVRDLMATIGQLPLEEKPAAGKQINSFRSEVEARLEKHRSVLAASILQTELEEIRSIDLTLPSQPSVAQGSLHPVTLMLVRTLEILTRLGFEIIETPEIVSDWENFRDLNFPPDHPARDAQKTFYLLSDPSLMEAGPGRAFSDDERALLLRSHTSAGQVKVLQDKEPPFRVAIPGRCFRDVETGPTLDTTFFQVEGLYVDHDLSIANMLAVMDELITEIFKGQQERRIRAGYFPFVEPGFEIDVACPLCSPGKECAGCKGSGWLEVLPCGMVHSKVLERRGMGRYSGFAFGLGITRLAMIQFKIEKIASLHTTDLRFLRQLGTAPLW